MPNPFRKESRYLLAQSIQVRVHLNFSSLCLVFGIKMFYLLSPRIVLLEIKCIFSHEKKFYWNQITTLSITKLYFLLFKTITHSKTWIYLLNWNHSLIYIFHIPLIILKQLILIDLPLFIWYSLTIISVVDGDLTINAPFLWPQQFTLFLN